jgi:hypothetical protein
MLRRTGVAVSCDVASAGHPESSKAAGEHLPLLAFDKLRPQSDNDAGDK